MNILESGKFYAGCNYWASHAGVRMWSDWNEEVVDKDFEQLKDLGIKLVRVFPLWSDFQPVKKITGCHGKFIGYSVNDGDTILDNFDYGVSEVMMSRFEKMLDLASKHGLYLIPSILTGWMSGRLFVPPILDDRDLITDTLAIKWQVRFIRVFVERFKNHPVVAAWCIGNECNCMGTATTEEEAWLWISTMSNAIRSVDNTKPVISGMHSQYTPGETEWTLQAGGENCDYLTTHPYTSPTYSTDRELMNTIKPLLHPAAQTLYVRGIGKKPCIIEETGTFGQMYGNEEFTAKYSKGAIYTAWAHDCLTYLWWIGYDQGSLTYHPFGYNNRASNYGLYREDRSLKPVGEVMKEFNKFIADFKYDKLPSRIVDAICILTRGQKTWKTAGSTFVLAKQAGIDIDFAYANDPLPEAKAYFMPCLASQETVSAQYLSDLMNRVEKGATLYVSVGNGTIRNMGSDFGFKILSRKTSSGADSVVLDGSTLSLKSSCYYNVEKTTAKSLAVNQEGRDVFLSADYGKGKVYFLMYPMEFNIFDVLDVYEDSDYYKIYKEIAKSISSDKVATVDSKMVGVTEHIVNDNERIIIAINYSSQSSDVTLSLKDGWKFSEVLKGSADLNGDTAKVSLENVETSVFVIKK